MRLLRNLLNHRWLRCEAVHGRTSKPPQPAQGGDPTPVEPVETPLTALPTVPGFRGSGAQRAFAPQPAGDGRRADAAQPPHHAGALSPQDTVPSTTQPNTAISRFAQPAGSPRSRSSVYAPTNPRRPAQRTSRQSACRDPRSALRRPGFRGSGRRRLRASTDDDVQVVAYAFAPQPTRDELEVQHPAPSHQPPRLELRARLGLIELPAQRPRPWSAHHRTTGTPC